jgi:4-alpha-glucanotransferase
VVDPQRWGVDVGYHDAAGVWRQPPAATIEAILEAMGAGSGDPAEGRVVVTAPDRPAPVVGPGRLVLEDGAVLELQAGLPADLPFGYHRFEPAQDGAEVPAPVRLINSPGRCWFRPDLRLWGWATQLYATRSEASWGLGDLADLRRLGRWAARKGAGVTLVSPLHAALPAPHQEPSPYFASSRCFRNPLYLRVEEVPGAERLPELPELARAGRILNRSRRIDRDAVWRLKSRALESLYAVFDGDRSFDRYQTEQGRDLKDYATFCALGERHGYAWKAWPSGVRRPDGSGVSRFASTTAGRQRARYHAWLQWLLDCQLQRAAAALPLVTDLALGARADGADAWRWQDCLAEGVCAGAPPDEFNGAGQNWALPPFDPWRLRAAAYEPFVRVVRAGLRHAAGLRLDHVMGLFRLFWIPQGAEPAEGTYVRYPWRDLLDILALESDRAGAFLVGEDLGTVEDFCRDQLRHHRVLSYRLLWFEGTRPDSGHWPHQALAAVTTHDLPTVAGLWSGSDLAVQRSLGLEPNEEGTLRIRQRLSAWTGLDSDASSEDAIQQAYRLLGTAPSAIVSATLDDALAVEDRPNIPGTTAEWPNWSLALPRSLEELETAPLAEIIRAGLGRRSRDGDLGPSADGPGPPP